MFWDILHSAVFDFCKDDSLKIQTKEIKWNRDNFDIRLNTPKKVFRSVLRGNVSETTLLRIVGNEFVVMAEELAEMAFGR